MPLRSTPADALRKGSAPHAGAGGVAGHGRAVVRSPPRCGPPCPRPRPRWGHRWPVPGQCHAGIRRAARRHPQPSVTELAGASPGLEADSNRRGPGPLPGLDRRTRTSHIPSERRLLYQLSYIRCVSPLPPDAVRRAAVRTVPAGNAMPCHGHPEDGRGRDPPVRDRTAPRGGVSRCRPCVGRIALVSLASRALPVPPSLADRRRYRTRARRPGL